MRKNITLIVAAAACALLAYGFWNWEAASHDENEDHEHHHHEDEIVSISSDQIKAHGIEIQKAAPGRLQYLVTAPAKIMLAQDGIAHIYPKVSGTVIQAYKNLGEDVAVNEVIATLSSREMAEAKADYLAAYNRDLLTQGTFQREKSLHEKKISATQEYHRAENAREESLIELELTRQKLHALGLSEEEIASLPLSAPATLRVYEMRSPVAGKVIARHLTTGELVTLDHEAYIVADLNSLWAEISVFPQDRQHVKEGQPVTIATLDGRATMATVTYLSPIVDEDTHTSTAIAKINNKSGKWLPGTYAKAELITAVVNIPLVVTKEAVQNIDGTDVIFLTADGGFSVRPIQTGRSDARNFEVVSGLAPGEEYAYKNTFLLKAELKKDEAEHMD